MTAPPKEAPESPVQRISLTSRDPDEASRALTLLFGAPVETTTDPGQGFAVDARAELSPEFSWLDLGLLYRGRADRESQAEIVVAGAWAGEHRWVAQGVRGGGSLPLVVLPGRSAHAEFDDLRMFAATLPADRVEPQLDGLDIGAAPQLGDLGRPQGPGAEALSALLRLLGAAHRRDPEIFEHPLLRARAAEAVLTGLVSAAPAAAPSEATDNATSASLRRAIAFIESAADRPVTVGEIAAAARMSIRGLQALFQRELGVSPIAYQRRVRLDGARQDLLAADPNAGATVAAIARRWGFVQTGRFAGDYLAAFGEYPRATLQR